MCRLPRARLPFPGHLVVPAGSRLFLGGRGKRAEVCASPFRNNLLEVTYTTSRQSARSQSRGHAVFMSRNREISKGPLCTISFTGRLRIQSVDSWKHHEQCLVCHPRSHHRALSSSCTEWRREGLALRTRTCPKNLPLNCPFLFFLIPEWTLGSGLRREAEGLHLLHSRASNSRQEPGW